MPVREPLQRLRQVARGPVPVVGLARPPRRLLTALRAAAEEAAAGAARLALLDAAPRSCGTLLADMAEHTRRADLAARESRNTRSRGTAVAVRRAAPGPPAAASHGCSGCSAAKRGPRCVVFVESGEEPGATVNAASTRARLGRDVDVRGRAIGAPTTLLHLCVGASAHDATPRLLEWTMCSSNDLLRANQSVPL